MTHKPITPSTAQKDAGGSTQVAVGKTVFSVKVHFGKESLEDILRRRILAERWQKSR